MVLTDLHVHSRCSPDGSAPMYDLAAAAAAAGLQELCITDHCDLLDRDGNLVTAFDWAPLEREFAAIGRWEGLNLRLGLELGEAQEAFEAAEEILRNPNLDFVIGSQHNLSGALGGKDFFFLSYQSEDFCYRCLDDYLANLEQLSARGCYDVLGHIVYPLRYMRDRDGQAVSLSRYRERIGGILRAAAEQNKGIELNTNRGKSMEEWLPILRQFKECGGEIVTIGSDAHRPQDVGKGVREARALLLQAGFRYFAVYEKRSPIFFPLERSTI